MRRAQRWLPLLTAAGLLGTMFDYGTGCLGQVARNINPCGTVLNCDPLEYDMMWADYTRPDYALDPTCTMPGFCGGTPYPPVTGDVVDAPPHDSGVGGIPGAATTTGTTTGGG